jgi:hypothetical protein
MILNVVAHLVSMAYLEYISRVIHAYKEQRREPGKHDDCLSSPPPSKVHCNFGSLPLIGYRVLLKCLQNNIILFLSN